MSTTAPASRNRCWHGCASWWPGRAGPRVPVVDHDEFEQKLAEATRAGLMTSPTHWSNDSARSRRFGWCVEERFPEAYRRTYRLRRRHGRGDLERLSDHDALDVTFYEDRRSVRCTERRFKVFSGARAGLAFRLCFRSSNVLVSMSQTSGLTRWSCRTVLARGSTTWASRGAGADSPQATR